MIQLVVTAFASISVLAVLLGANKAQEIISNVGYPTAQVFVYCYMMPQTNNNFQTLDGVQLYCKDLCVLISFHAT